MVWLETVGWWPEKQNWFIGERAEHQMMLIGTVLQDLILI